MVRSATQFPMVLPWFNHGIFFFFFFFFFFFPDFCCAATELYTVAEPLLCTFTPVALKKSVSLKKKKVLLMVHHQIILESRTKKKV